jgi:putative DNA primase/helicase
MNKIIKFKDINSDFLTPTSTGYTLDRIKFGIYFLSKHSIYTVEKDVYIYKSGVYQYVSDNILKAMIENEFEKKGISKCHWIKESLEKIKLKTTVSVDKFNSLFDKNPNIINVKNGIIELKDNKVIFKEHDPKYLTTIQLNVNYNKNAKIDRFKYFLETSLSTDKERLLLQEHLGYHFYNSLPGQYFYCFHGTGGNGKGVYFKLIREILGSSNVVMERSSMLSETSKQNQFYGMKFSGKLCIQVPETAYYLNNMDFIKILSGGDMQDVELKNQNNYAKFEFKGKLSIATNDKIKIRIDDGVERRIVFVKMDNKPIKVLPNLFTDLLCEIEGIFNWGLEGLLRINNNNWKHTLPESHFNLFSSYWVHSDNYLRFVRTFIQTGISVPRSELIQKFIEEFGNMHKNKLDIREKLEEALKTEGYPILIKKVRCASLFGGEKNTPCYIGISYTEYKEEEKKTIIKNIPLEIRNNILSMLKNMADFQLEPLEFYLNTIFECYDLTEIKQVIEDRKNQSKINRGYFINNIIESNIKKTENIIKTKYLDDDNWNTGILKECEINLNTDKLEDVCKLFFDKKNINFNPPFTNERALKIRNEYLKAISNYWNIENNMSFENINEIILNKQKES